MPDPASVHGSPASSSRSASPRPASQHVLSAVPPGLMAKLSRPTSLSGLFTPYSETSSGPSSPVMPDSAHIPEKEDAKTQEAPSAAAGEDGGRGEDVEDATSSPELSPLAASVDAMHDVEHDHDADLDAEEVDRRGERGERSWRGRGGSRLRSQTSASAASVEYREGRDGCHVCDVEHVRR